MMQERARDSAIKARYFLLSIVRCERARNNFETIAFFSSVPMEIMLDNLLFFKNT